MGRNTMSRNTTSRGTLNRSGLAIAIGCALLAPAAWAQDAAAPEEPTAQAAQADARNETVTLGAVTVTARKREETLQDVPVAVTAFPPMRWTVSRSRTSAASTRRCRT